MKNIFVKVGNEFVANILTNAIAKTEANDSAAVANKKIGISRKSGKLILNIPEANVVAKALENYSKTTTHTTSAKLAKSLATAIRFKTAAACKAENYHLSEITDIESEIARCRAEIEALKIQNAELAKEDERLGDWYTILRIQHRLLEY